MMYDVSCMLYFMIYDGGIMFETYIKTKQNYPKSVIMIKVGNFYVCLNDDAIVMNRILNYKIKEFNNYIRVGFPTSNINKVKMILTKYEINYVTVDNNDTIYSKFTKNNYSKYNSNDYFIIKNKINDITNILNNNIENPDINNIIKIIESILCKIN